MQYATRYIGKSVYHKEKKKKLISDRFQKKNIALGLK